MFLADWKTPGKHQLTKKKKFLAQGHDENLLTGLPVNNRAREKSAAFLFFLPP